jgi:hypothetical protein
MPNAADKIKVGVAMVLENLQSKSMGNGIVAAINVIN